MTEPVRIEIERLPLPKTGTGSTYRYRVHHAGAVLIESARDPSHEAARALLALGITGRAETFALGGLVSRLRFDIEGAATRTTIDGEKQGPVIAKWRPIDRDAFAAHPSEATEANEEGELPQWPSTQTPVLDRSQQGSAASISEGPF